MHTSSLILLGFFLFCFGVFLREKNIIRKISSINYFTSSCQKKKTEKKVKQFKDNIAIVHLSICIGRKVIHTKSLNRRGKLINNGDETQQNMYTKI